MDLIFGVDLVGRIWNVYRANHSFTGQLGRVPLVLSKAFHRVESTLYELMNTYKTSCDNGV